MIDLIKIVTVKSQLYELNKKIFEVCSLQVLAGEHVKISQIDKVIKKCKYPWRKNTPGSVSQSLITHSSQK